MRQIWGGDTNKKSQVFDSQQIHYTGEIEEPNKEDPESGEESQAGPKVRRVDEE